MAVLAILSCCGCAAVAGTAVTTGVSYTFSNVAYRTFDRPKERVHQAVLRALGHMDMRVVTDHAKGTSTQVLAKAGRYDVDVKIEPITDNATKISVTAKKNVLLRDKATAAEVINQTARALGVRSSTETAWRSPASHRAGARLIANR
jgi:hypothetical protein